ncbi:transposase [Micromonospora sp. CPCC 206061]|uniref:transposase n=1 Tax=Micromonospora sp. CPCC 206061 TaxID=3122410 RepID=UPI003FA53EBB
MEGRAAAAASAGEAQGGGKRRADDRACLAAIVYMVQAGCSWRKLPAVFFGVSRPTVHRRFTQWFVEACLSWLTNNRRLARCYERKA